MVLKGEVSKTSKHAFGRVEAKNFGRGEEGS